MKRFRSILARGLLIVVAAVGAGSLALAVEASGSGAVEQVKAATLAFYAALNRADAVAADRFLLPGGDSFPRNGKELDPEASTEQESLRNLAQAFAAGLRFKVTLRDLQVKAYGDTAVATFYTDGVTTAADRTTAQGIYRASYVWVKGREGWRIAHFHISPLVRGP